MSFAHRSIARIDVHHTYFAQRAHLPVMSGRAPEREVEDLVKRCTLTGAMCIRFSRLYLIFTGSFVKLLRRCLDFFGFRCTSACHGLTIASWSLSSSQLNRSHIEQCQCACRLGLGRFSCL